MEYDARSTVVAELKEEEEKKDEEEQEKEKELEGILHRSARGRESS